MIRFHEGTGSSQFEVLDERFSVGDWARFKTKTCEFLSRRGLWPAAEFLDQHDLVLKRATNTFGDEFCVLHERLPMDKYVLALDLVEDMQVRANAKDAAQAVQEVTGEYVRFVAVELDSSDTPQAVPSPILKTTSATVERALNDAARLIATEGSTSAVDRVHTAFHGYLRALAREARIDVPDAAGLTEVFKLVRTEHPSFALTGKNHAAIDKILRSLSSVVDALNPLRNHSSVAHANDELLEEPEAMLVINGVRTLLHYFNSRTGL